MYKQMIPADVIARKAQFGGATDRMNASLPSYEVSTAQIAEAESQHPVALEKQLAAEEERCLRLAADFENFKKRAAQELDRRATVQKDSLVRDLLPVAHPDRTILEVCQRGWLRGKDLFRPAKVVVNDLNNDHVIDVDGADVASFRKVAEAPEPTSGLRYDKNATCDRCGKFGAFDLGGRLLCAGCYEEAGACCPEFGAADLWRERDKD